MPPMQTSRLPAGLVEGHAERVAADMREHFRALMIGAEEAHDVAMARAAIEIVVAIEDDVLRPFDLAEADDLDGAQAVVEHIRRAGCVDLRRRRQRQIGGRDIDLGQDAVAVLLPAHVDEDGEQEDHAEDRRGYRTADAEIDQAVGQHEHEQAANDGLGDRAAAAADGGAAEHGGGQRLNLQADAGVGSRAAEAGREQEAGQRAHGARRDIGEEHHEAHIDAGIEGRAPRPADGRQPPAGPHARQHQMPGERDDQRDHQRHRNT